MHVYRRFVADGPAFCCRQRSGFRVVGAELGEAIPRLRPLVARLNSCEDVDELEISAVVVLSEGGEHGNHLIVGAAAACGLPAHLFLNAMPLVARLLDHLPSVRQAGLVAIMGHRRELPIDDPALIIRRLHMPLIGVARLIRAGEGIHAHDLPSFGEALVFLGGPFGASASTTRSAFLSLAFLSRSRRVQSATQSALLIPGGRSFSLGFSAAASPANVE